MSSDKFDFIITEIPVKINKDMIRSLRKDVSEIDIAYALEMNILLELDTSEVSGESLREEDLFDIADEDLKTKKVIQDFLDEAISQVLVPRMYCENRISSELSNGEISYISIKDRPHVISGQQNSYYSSRKDSSYKYVLALSMSDMLTKFIEK